MSRDNGQTKIPCGYAWFTYPVYGKRKAHWCDILIYPHTKHGGRHKCHCGQKR